jgi:glycosyltransferase involved in cell wall biosynthesis
MTADHLTQPRVLRPLAPLAERLIVRQSNLCDAVVVPSERLADGLPGRGVTAPCHYVRNPVAFEDAPAAVVPRDEGRFVVLFAGRLDEEKNVSLLLRAFAALSPDRESTELWIAGRGRQRRLLERLARELGISHRVRFLGFLDHEELAKRYAAAHVFVLPSRVETHGMVVVEAMRFGTPAIVTDRIVSARELVEHGRDGYVVADDPAALSRALERLRADPSLRAQLGRRAAESARAYSVKASVDALEAIYGALPPSSGEHEAA